RPAGRGRGDREGRRRVSRRTRLLLFAAAGPALFAFLLWTLAGLPDFGHFHGGVGNLLNRVAVHERHTSNVVASVVFDYRGLDTMGEELILFSSVMGVALLLRSFRPAREGRPELRVQSDAIRLVGGLVVPVTFLPGLWLAA